MGTQLGDVSRAAAIATYDLLDGAVDLPAGVTYLGAGSQRTVYLDATTNTVYKVGDDSANREEVHVFAQLRDQGHRHAPVATLYETTVAYWCYGERIDFDRTVVAMPYLPHDPEVTERPVLVGAGDLNPINSHYCHGQWWLIDAGGM